MIINRNNYEECFLLYVDNELDEVQKAAVENFVQQNPDVAGELEMLKQSTLHADDDIRFASKEVLYKTEEGISLSNYEEYFLLAIDNELNNDKAAQVEKFVLQHPQLQQEFILLQQTILPKEVVGFGDKSTLYRQEKSRRIIPIAFVRLSVAAAFIGIIATLWMFNRSENVVPSPQPLAVHKGVQTLPKQPAHIKVTDAVTQHPIASLDLKDEHIKASLTKYVAHNKAHKQNANPINISSVINKVNPPATTKNEVAINEPIKSTIENSIANNTTTDVSSVDKSVAKATLTKKENTIDEKPVIQQAVYHEVDGEEDNNSIYIGAAEINKTKLKALLRKAVNLFERKTNKSDPDKTLQIASFQIKSK